MRNLLPIRKVVVGLVGSGLTWAAMRLGLDLGSDAANQAAQIIVGVVFAYAERDPRVATVIRDIERAVEKPQA